ncbi:unnamed protein product [Ectocarpus sp. 12 AP-2014]
MVDFLLRYVILREKADTRTIKRHHFRNVLVCFTFDFDRGRQIRSFERETFRVNLCLIYRIVLLPQVRVGIDRGAVQCARVLQFSCVVRSVCQQRDRIRYLSVSRLRSTTTAGCVFDSGMVSGDVFVS